MISNIKCRYIRNDNEHINIKRLLFIGISTCFIVIGALISYGSYGLNYYVKNSFLLSIAILFLFLIYDHVTLNNLRIFFFWFLLLFLAISSEILNGRQHMVNLISIFLFVSIASELSDDSYKTIHIAIICAELVFSFKYKLTEYFNSYALATALLGIEILVFLYLQKNEKTWLYITVFVAFLVALYIMASRTSLIAFSIAGIILLVKLQTDKGMNKWVSIFLLIFLAAIILWQNSDRINTLLFAKWESLGYQTKDISSGRFIMWNDFLNNHLNLWGHNDSFVIDTYNHGDMHNVFVQTLCKYGIFTFAAFALWIISIIIRIRYLPSKYKIVFISLFSFYLFAGMAENVLFLDCKSFMITFIFCAYLAQLYKLSDLGQIKDIQKLHHDHCKYLR